jgi:hypothetical protein
MPWLLNYARMMECTTVGFMVGAFFLNRAHFDLIYHWFALTSCLVLVARREAMHSSEPALAEGEESERVEFRWRSAAPHLAARWGR